MPPKIKQRRNKSFTLPILAFEHKLALLFLSLAIVCPILFSVFVKDAREQTSKESKTGTTCPFGYTLKAKHYDSRNVDEEDVELPSWHPKIVSYDIDEERNAFGPPVLRKNEIAKFDNVLMFHGKFWFMEEAMFKSSIAMNNRTKRIIAIADSTEDARKMKETFRNAGVFIEDVIVFDDENDDDDDLSAKVIVPGFHDSHTHVMSLGMKMEFEIDLADVKTKQEFVLKLKIKERNWAPFPSFRNEWIIAQGYDEQKIKHAHTKKPDLPFKGWIDDISNPVICFRADMHVAIVNKAGFKAANVRWVDVKKNTSHDYYKRFRDYIDFDSGEVKDDALQLFQKVLPKRTKRERKNALKKAILPLSKLGITRISDFGAIDALQAYDFQLSRSDYMIMRELDNEMRPHGLPIRINCYLPLDDWEFASQEQDRGNGAFFHYTGYKGNELRQKELNLDQTIRSNVRIAGVKVFLDGSLGANTAKFHEPYENSKNSWTQVGNSGMFVRDMEQVKELAIKADKAELQIAVHAIGDAAVDAALDILEALEKINGPRDRRFRIEHMQHLSSSLRKKHDDTVESRAKRLKPIASVQPLHLALDSEETLVQKLGKERAERTHMYKTLSDSTQIAFGSDVPIAPADPVEAILAASSKRSHEREKQALTVNEALKAQTIAGAYASFNELAFGGFFKGAVLDFVVLAKTNDAVDDHDTTSTTNSNARSTEGEEEIINNRTVVFETWVSGRKVFARDRRTLKQ